MQTRNIPTKVRLTNKVIDALAALEPSARARRYWDTEFPGFYLQFSNAGTGSFYLRYTKADGRDGDFAIGRSDRVPVDGARTVAREKLSAFTLHGIDPVEDRRKARDEAQGKNDRTFAALVEAYIARKSKLRDGKPLAEWFMLRRYLIPALGKLDIGKISEQRIVDTLEDIRIGVATRDARKNATGRTTATQCHKAVKRFFKWAVASDYIVKNPADFAGLYKGGAKKRYGRMNEQRLGLFWDAMVAKYQQSTWATLPLASLLYMATLQRPVDICQARKQDINLATRTWIIPDFMTKTGVEYFIPLSDLAVGIIQEAMRLHEGDALFPGHLGAERVAEASMTGCWTYIRQALFDQGAIPDLDIELYDCRRFGRTYIEVNLKHSEAVSEGVINHHNESRMESRYNVHNYQDEVRAAQEAWGDALLSFSKTKELSIYRPMLD